MGVLKTPLIRKLEKALGRRFSGTSKIKLEDHDGIVGVVTSVEFAGMESLDRQNLIGSIIEKNLSPTERRHVQVIVAVTPEEATGYLASD